MPRGIRHAFEEPLIPALFGQHDERRFLADAGGVSLAASKIEEKSTAAEKGGK